MILLFALLIIAAVFSTRLSSRLGLPVLVAFIGIGLLVGSDGLNLIYFDDAALSKRIADVLLIFILFTGGFQTRKSSLKAVAGPSLTLATLGVAMTAGFLGFLIHLISRLPLAQCFMISSIISSTDAAAVMMITKSNPLQDKIATTIEIESASNDPAAILLTIAFVEIVSGSKAANPGLIVLQLAWQFGGGVLVGLALSRVGRFLFDRLESESRGYYHALVIGVILLAYGAAELARANGIIAVFFMGYWLGNMDFAGKRGVSNFLEGVSASANIALFLMLGLLAFPRNFPGIMKEGLFISILLIFAVRPAVVFLCILPFKYTWRERLFIMWGGIKGAVPIVLATYPAAYGLDPDGAIFNIIFFAVLVSCLVQGTTMAPFAKLLGLTVPPKPHSPHSLELHSMRKTNIDMFEIRIEPDAWAIGKRVRDLDIPADTLIASIIRDGRIVPPKGTTSIRKNDIMYVLGPIEGMEALSGRLNGGPA